MIMVLLYGDVNFGMACGIVEIYELLPCIPLLLDWIAIVIPFLIWYDLHIVTFIFGCYGDLYVLNFNGGLL